MSAALCSAAHLILQFSEYGTLEAGKAADFFTAKRDFAGLKAEEVVDFRPTCTYYKGNRYCKKKGSILELAGMMLRRPEKI
ncbi:MAG: hypothetical protein KBS63_05340 [Clostridiales bacterium]|nr:hypothetical protein [Candidatus Crickella caballi]